MSMEASVVQDIATYELAGRQIVILSIVVLYLGTFINDRISFFRKNSIPASVTGGLVCSAIVAMLTYFSVVKLSFNLELRNLLLLFFFSTIGLNAKFRSLLTGGKALAVLLAACTIFLFIQNFVGISIATLVGSDPVLGLFGGSISLAGGHGTAIAWGEVASEMGIAGASGFGIACATFGLIAGGLLGGPVAVRLIRKKNLRPESSSEEMEAEAEAVECARRKKRLLSVEDLIGTILALALCVAFGDTVNRYLFGYDIRLPGFLTAMMAGLFITNVADPMRVKLNHDGIDIVGGVSLQMFLAMSLMSMDLLALADAAFLLMAVMVVQVAAAALFGVYVVFRLMGSDYDAAIITGGFLGLGLGATPVAIASMDAAAKKLGPSAKALLVVPLVGAFFIDLVNAVTIELLLKSPLLN